ncbi:insulin-induced protein-domain-containing protein [Annulohypoxylon maeteangense]|uniref:insulin-induced protein-domain-containing protein n=1 Tax=Annulohypoxylon maeteangense TaxID=1927788 RepID=UPI002008CC83|nr:insulin-induced protein-domain-containing protein [Annulohypoxylon maeteangense]KAI0880814.1 insulin-induced protein-domain-containing protein [Annulohypoxylon maeteangense]
MGKRKRTDGATNGAQEKKPALVKKAKKAKASELSTAPVESSSLTIQVVTGSYDRILHGLTATISADDQVEFADTFLFNAHNSAIRCLALSPPSAPEHGKLQKVMLASGSSDERINVYNISAHPPSRKHQDALSSVAPRKILENPKNREIGTLLHHSSTVTKLSFPTKSKLISASEDSTIAVTRTRDWSLLSSIKTPIPKPQGRPSGDTAPLGATPAGVNDFAVHPSMKLMISVSRGERCMRLWNLMTAKKAGVLNFSRDMLQDVGEGKHSSGEGRKVVWGNTEDGDEFCVGFDRDALVFGMDSTPKCRVMPEPKSKIHEINYVTIDAANDSSLLAVSTEDGKILFLSTRSEDLTPSKSTEGKGKTSLPMAKLIAQVGGKDAGVSGRIKDFSINRMSGKGGEDDLVIAAGSSDGKIRIFKVAVAKLKKARKSKIAPTNRITCVEAFTMIPRPEGDSGPPLLRPIPLRPFDLHRREPTPPEDEPIPPLTNSGHSSSLNLDILNSRLLDRRNNGSAPESASISRAQSALDITGSTLMGIYNQANFSKDKLNYLGVDEPSTPWGTGAETPAKGLKVDSPHYELQKERAQPTRRRSSLHTAIRPQPLSISQRTLYLGSRGLFLFVLGVLYGMLVAQLRDRRQGTGHGSYNFGSLAFWGISAVVMGSLLPWIDGIWERVVGCDEVAVESAADHGMGGDIVENEPASSTDWALAVRGIGAFVGIAFAIRKLPWDSTLQVSITLALANPVLWFLIDRSMPGFLLSATVGIAGAMVLLGLKPDMVPTPTNPSASIFPGYDTQYDNTSSGFAQQQQQRSQEFISFGGVTVTQEEFGTVIFMMSILFCCCVCFGNIGRWIALNRGTVTRGRWAERR